MKDRTLEYMLSMPFIYMMIVPLVILDVFLAVFQHICFPLYGLPLVERKRYIRMDRHHLSYLTPIQKFNCAYCGYANGVLQYAVAIGATTEKYWCAIKHKKVKGYLEPAHHKSFAKFGDKKAWQSKK